jgi:hypothetical protein
MSKRKVLQTEQNTRPMGKRVLAAARRVLGNGQSYQAGFEHGQWWVSVLGSGAQYSVVDATGANTYDGFGFELVTRGDEE